MEGMISAVVAGIGVGMGLAIYYWRKSRADAPKKEQILAMLQENDALSLLEIVTGLGLKDGFMNRGKVLTLINPLVASKALTQQEPPGTTPLNRLDSIRFSISK